jgi:hypothetical protein
MTLLLPILHIGPGGSSQASIWLLGVTAGFVLAVGLNRLIGTRG